MPQRCPSEIQLVDVFSFTKRLVISGSRTWNQYWQFAAFLETYLKRLGRENCVIISGDAKYGADAMAVRWCIENDFPFLRQPADWSKGRGAGYARNAEMNGYSTHLLAFWDMESRGTKHMIDISEEANRRCTICFVQHDAFFDEIYQGNHHGQKPKSCRIHDFEVGAPNPS